MADLGQTRSKLFEIRYSHYLGAPTLISMGINVSLGVSVYLLLGFILKLVGGQTPRLYLLILFFFLPISATLAERASIIRDAGGLYDLTRARENIRLGFVNGWLLLGGLLALGAVLTWGIGIYANMILARFLQAPVNSQWLMGFLLLLIAGNQFLGTYAEWRKRRTLIFISLLLLGLLLIMTLLNPLGNMGGYVYFPSVTELDVIAYLAIGLWGFYFILERADQARSKQRLVFSSLLTSILLLSALGAAAAYVLLRYPPLIISNDLPLVALAEVFHPLLALVVAGVITAVLLVGLNQVFTSLFLLAEVMTQDGLLPPALTAVSGKRQVPLRLLILATSLILTIAVFLPTNIMIAFAAASLLGSLAVIHSQDIFQKAPKLPENRWLKLPLHPLFPGIVVLVCLTMILVQPILNHLALGAWLLLGAGLYFAYSRQATISRVQAEVVVAQETETAVHAQTDYRLLVCISHPETAMPLIQAGAALAQANKGVMYVLTILDTPEQSPDKQAFAKEQLAVLQAHLDSMPLAAATAVPLVRLAPTPTAGILATAWEEKANSILLGWPTADQTPKTLTQERTIDQLVRHTSQEIIVLRGSMPETIRQILVPMTSDGHQLAALTLGQQLKQNKTDVVMAVKPVRERLTDDANAAYSQQLSVQINKLEDTSDISTQIVQVANLEDALVTAGKQYDLVLMGLSDEGFLANTTFSGLPVDVAERSETPVILVKSAERREHFWLRQVWDRLTNWLPGIDTHQQAAVYLGMRRDARATIDYYVLILLATMIAYFGLLQSSAAVIIGAMLIAPLMSPILAMAQSIVQGNTRLLRQAGNTTFNGVLVAIGTAVSFTFMLIALGFPVTPTPEILARTQPNVLDLMVALASGAAAAYAVSRKEVASALPGVAIAAALVPPLAVVGHGIGALQFGDAAGALLLFTTNLAAIILAGAVTFLALGFRPPTRSERGEQTRYGLQMAVAALIVISVPLVFTTFVTNRQTQTFAEINTMILNYWQPSVAQVKDVTLSQEGSEITAEFQLYDFSGRVDTNEVITLQRQISEAVNQIVILRTTIINGRLEIIDNQTQFIPTPTITPTITTTAAPTATGLPTATSEPPAATAAAPTTTPAAVATATAAPDADQ